MITIIPAIDLIDGKCVRLTQGDYSKKKIYNENPLDVALQFEDIGINRLHLVDLDGAKAGRPVNMRTLDLISSETDLIIDYGGGIKTDDDIQMVFEAGAEIASIGSVAARDPELFFSWVEQYGHKKILLGTDVKAGQVVISGWQEITKFPLMEFINKNYKKGIRNIFCTDVAMDGMLQGPSTDLYKMILMGFPGINLIASGGVRSMSDVEELEKAGCSGVIIGKALYEKHITLDELKAYILKND